MRRGENYLTGDLVLAAAAQHTHHYATLPLRPSSSSSAGVVVSGCGGGCGGGGDTAQVWWWWWWRAPPPPLTLPAPLVTSEPMAGCEGRPPTHPCARPVVGSPPCPAQSTQFSLFRATLVSL